MPRFNGVIRGLFCLVWLVTVLEGALNAASPPIRWRWSNPRPFGGDVYDMAYGLGLTVAVTERGGIFTSEDLVFWEPRDGRTTNALRAVTFFGNRLVITGERGITLHADSLQDFHTNRLDTEDWLEGVAASTNLLVAVGDNGAIYTSGNGANWHRQAPAPAITAWLSGVAFGQGNFVAVGENGFIATSPNGTNWTKRTSNTTRYLHRIGWTENQFVAVGEGGLILSSANGTTWSSATGSGATGALYSATGSLEGQTVVGENELRLRKAGSSWSNELDPSKAFPAPRWTYFNALWQGSLYFISGRSGLLIEGFQTNATAPFVWVDRSPAIRNWLWEVHRSAESYVAVGHRGTIMTSVGGMDWNLELVPPSVTNKTLFGVGGTTNLLIAVGGKGSIISSPSTFTNLVSTNLGGTVVTNAVNTLGIFWYPVPSPTTNDLQGVTVFGDQFVLTGDYGTVLTSVDGTNWQKRATPTTQFLTGVAAFPSGLVAVGAGGALLTSPDGVHWTNQASGTTNWLYRVRCLGDRLIVVGQNGTILTSADGFNWTRQNSTTTRWLNDVTVLSNTFYVVGTHGTVLVSSNAVNWTSCGTITEKSLYSVTSHEGQLIAAGVEGAIVRSQIIPDMTPVEFVGMSRRDGQNLFLFSGRPGQRFALERSTGLSSWVTGLTLEFLDSSGTLLLLENEVTNAPPAEYYRARIVW